MSVQPYKRYTNEELARLRSDKSLENWQARGYHWRHNLDGTTQLVHWRDVPGTAGRPLRDNLGSAQFTAPPIRKRTPVERVDSLMLRWINDMKRAGGLPTLNSGVAPRVALEGGGTRPPTTAEKEEFARRKRFEEDQNEARIKEIVGAAWTAGRTEITADIVRQVAAKFLGVAENQFEESESHKVTRTAPSD